MKVLIFLQNAWSAEYAGEKWPRKLWLEALERSRSGQRLRSLVGRLGGGFTWRYENASPHVGDNPNSFMEADIHHMRKAMLDFGADIVVALGKEAQRGAMLGCDPPLTILAPHPASRVLTNHLYEQIGSDISMLRMGFRAVPGCTLVSYKQKRGQFVTHPESWLVSEFILGRK